MAAVAASKGAKTVPMHTFSGPVEHAIAHIEEAALHSLPQEQQRWYAIKIFERDSKVLEQLKIPADTTAHIETDIKAAEESQKKLMKRIGYQGKEFMIFKFRTLSITAPDNVATRKLENIDGCSTKLGRLLRRLSIDELPQLFNILRGDMSFVGFRPVCTSEKKLNALRRKMGVFEGRPGLTGYAQVLGRDSIGVARKARLDAEYQRKRSLRLDLWCMVKSVTVVLSGSGVM